MKVDVTIKMQIETEDYLATKPTLEDAKELIDAMVDGRADFPDEMHISVAPSYP